MCGIAGFISSLLPSSALGPMLQQISRRGPDGSGSETSPILDSRFMDWRVNLGHRRLSIIDVAGGPQPMKSPATRSVITYNGEIFNFLELSEDLKKSGISLKTRSDTEVLLEALALAAQKDQGFEEVLRSLNGMFAFGFWDEKHSRLLLARDRIGIKPLYYAPLKDGGIAFASELTAILELPGVFDKSIHAQAVTDFFFHDYVPAPDTIIKGVKKLAGGEYLVWEPGKRTEVKAYWTPEMITVDEVKSRWSPVRETELAGELLEKARGAVRRQLISDVPVGILLSGGVDSSFVSALAVQESSKKLQTFSIGFEDKSFDESAAAREIAQELGTDHHEEILSEAVLLGGLDKTLFCLDEPLGDASIIPTCQVAKLAHQNVKVCLGGDGGDELWAGYSFYGAHRWGDLYGKAPEWFRSGVFRPLVRSLPLRETYQSIEWKAKRFVNRYDDNRTQRHFRWLAGTDTDELERLLSLKSVPTYFDKFTTKDSDSLDALLRLDLVTYLPGSVLAKVDRATMSSGLEARPPFLDNEVMDFSLSVSSSLKLRDKTTKYLLKKAAGRIFSPRMASAVLSRPKKGFSVPISRWIRRELRGRFYEAIETSELLKSGLFDQREMKRIFEEHCSLKREWGKTLWSFFVFDHWYRRNSHLL